MRFGRSIFPLIGFVGIALGLTPGWTATIEELPVATSVCELNPSSGLGPYAGRDVSIRSLVMDDTHGVYLHDDRCPGNLVLLRFPDRKPDSVADLLWLRVWSRDTRVAVKSPHCICIGRIEYTPTPMLHLEKVDKIWIPE